MTVPGVPGWREFLLRLAIWSALVVVHASWIQYRGQFSDSHGQINCVLSARIKPATTRSAGEKNADRVAPAGSSKCPLSSGPEVSMEFTSLLMPCTEK